MHDSTRPSRRGAALALIAATALLAPTAVALAASGGPREGGLPRGGTHVVEGPVRVIDGETIEVVVDGRLTGVGLLGIDAPSRRKGCGEDSTEYLRSLVQYGLRLEDDPDPDLTFDERGRRMFHVLDRRGVVSLAGEQAKAGMARADGTGGKDRAVLASKENDAKRAQRGCLWRSGDSADGTAGAADSQVGVMAAAASVPAGFTDDLVVSGLVEPTGFSFLPDGRVLVSMKNGLVRVIKDGQLLPTPLIDLRDKVNDYWDRGLIGMAVDPSFGTAGNDFVYLAYTQENALAFEGTKTTRLARYAVSGDTASPATEKVLLGTLNGNTCKDFAAGTDCIPADSPAHGPGDIRFGADGSLFFSNGDASWHTFADDDALRSQNLDSLAGKMVRIDRATGAGLSGNPFWSSTAPGSVRSKVWVSGLRNAFRFTLRPSSGTPGVPFLGDVGWDTWEEVDVATPGANLGWPCYEGNARQSGYEPKPGCQSLYSKGATAVKQPLVTYGHDLGSSSTGGPFYTGTAFPTTYRGAYFYGDYTGGWIRYLHVGAANELTSGPSTFVSGIGGGGPLDLEVGPDGSLYYLTYSGELRRVSYAATDRLAPTVTAVSPAAGATGVSSAVNAVASFSEAMDPSSLTTSTFSLVKQGSPTAVTATLSYEPGSRTATLDPTVGLEVGAVYTATVRGGTSGARDLAGNALATDRTWSFTVTNTSTFVKGVNLNGGAVTVDGLAWQSYAQARAEGLQVGTVNAVTTSITPVPAVDAGTSSMLNSAIYTAGGTLSVGQALPNGEYSVSLWIMENYVTDYRSLDLRVEGVVTATGVGKLARGAWRSYGPYPASVRDGVLSVDVIAASGDPHLMGMSISRLAPSDTAAPTVSAVTPADGALAVAAATSPTVAFSEAMDAGTVTARTFSLTRQGDASPVPNAVTYDGSTRTAKLDPAADLLPGEVYTATVVGGTNGVKDSAGNALAADATWSFTVNRPPSATISSPDAAPGFRIGDVVTYSGSATDPEDGTVPDARLSWRTVIQHCPGFGTTCHAHPLTSSTGPTGSFTVPDHGDGFHLELVLTATDGSGASTNATTRLDPQTVDITLTTSPAGLKVVWGGEPATASPIVRRAVVGSSNQVSVPSPQGDQVFEAWSDGGAQQHAVLAGTSNAAYTARFTTAPAPAPLVTATAPSPGSTDVAPTTPVTATFSEPMASSTITASTFTLVKEGGTALPASVSYDDASRTATLEPAAPLDGGGRYTATVVGGSAGILSAAGVALAADAVWSWTTAAPPPPGYREVVLTDQPAGYWRLDEGSGRTAADSGPHGRTGTYVDGVTLAAPGLLASTTNPSAAFDGVDDRVSVADHAVLDVSTAFSLEAWVNAPAFSHSGGQTYPRILSKGRGGVGSAGSGYQLLVAAGVRPANRLKLELEKPGLQEFYSAAALVPGRTHHVVVTYDGAAVRFYVDGALSGTTATTGAVAVNAAPLLLGARGDALRHWQGRLDEVAVYGRALSATRVKAHYDVGSARATP